MIKELISFKRYAWILVHSKNYALCVIYFFLNKYQMVLLIFFGSIYMAMCKCTIIPVPVNEIKNMSEWIFMSLWQDKIKQNFPQICGICYIWGLLCQEQVSRAWTCNYIPQYLWDVIIYPCPWYLLLAQHFWYILPYLSQSIELFSPKPDVGLHIMI